MARAEVAREAGKTVEAWVWEGTEEEKAAVATAAVAMAEVAWGVETEADMEGAGMAEAGQVEGEEAAMVVSVAGRAVGKARSQAGMVAVRVEEGRED